jgi:DNA repair protein RecO (recombination protein O)
MQLVSSECIILRSQDYLERDRLVTFLARDAGRLRGIVKGSRKLTSRGVADFEPFARGVVYYSDKGHGGLVSIRKCDPQPPYLYLHGDYHKFLYAGYFAELMDLIPIAADGAEPFFLLLAESLEALCEPGSPRRLPLLRLRFELRFLELLGYAPGWEHCSGCGKALFRQEDGRAVPVHAAPHPFDIGRGGPRCPDCAAAHRHSLVLAAASLAFLQNWRLGVTGAAARPTRQALEELEAAVTGHLVYHLERRPRSLALLPTLDGLDEPDGPAPA